MWNVSQLTTPFEGGSAQSSNPGGTLLYAIAAAGIGWFVFSNKSRPLDNEPPYLPYRIPWLGHALEFASASQALFERARKHFGSNQPFTLMLGGQRFYIVTKASDATAVLRNSKSLSFDVVIAGIMDSVYNIPNLPCPNGNGSTFAMLHGDDHDGSHIENTHTFVRAHLVDPERQEILVARSASELSEQADIQLGRLAAPTTKCLEPQLLQWIQAFMATAISNAVFGRGLLKAFPDILDDLFEMDGSFPELLQQRPRWMARSAYQARDRINLAMQSYLESGEASKAAISVVKDRDESFVRFGIPNKLRGPSQVSLFHALHANSVGGGFWCLIHILKYPGLVERILEEVSPAFNSVDDGGMIQPSLLSPQHCPLLHSVWLETLRLVCSSSGIRKVQETTSVAGYTLYPDSLILCPSLPMQVSPENWGEDSSEFNPDRFLNIPSGDPRMTKMRPFGGGISLCPGRHFAILEIKLFIAIVLKNFDLEIMGEWPEYNFNVGGAAISKPLKDPRVRIRARGA